MRQAVASSDAPRPLGAYSPAIRAGNLLFISGQVPVDPATGTVVGTDIRAQTEQVMRNIGALLKSAGAGFDEFAEMNTCYAGFVTDPPPARATVQVARLPRDVKIEVDAIAVIP